VSKEQSAIRLATQRELIRHQIQYSHYLLAQDQRGVLPKDRDAYLSISFMDPETATARQIMNILLQTTMLPGYVESLLLYDCMNCDSDGLTEAICVGDDYEMTPLYLCLRCAGEVCQVFHGR
jgi:hypothetical protein